ncbi:hypothetical protein J4217_04485 [Candidatus Pacearchaeota archaeon]|nr:hypothetical protein [Candidatus Pacearchaeota archaeon]
MKLQLTLYEKKNYVLNDRKDLIILSKIKEVEDSKLDSKDKEVVKLIKTQLKKDWRSPFIVYLNKLIRLIRRHEK